MAFFTLLAGFADVFLLRVLLVEGMVEQSCVLFEERVEVVLRAVRTEATRAILRGFITTVVRRYRLVLYQVAEEGGSSVSGAQFRIPLLFQLPTWR